MSRASRKGDNREHEWAGEWDGEKLSKKGYKGPDVRTPPLVLASPMTIWEVKSKEDLPLWLVGESETREKRGWIPQMEEDGSHGIAFRQNYKDWYFIARASQLVKAEARVGLAEGVPTHITINGKQYDVVQP